MGTHNPLGWHAATLQHSSWGGVSTTTINKVQKIQNKVSKIAVGKNNYHITSKQREKLLNWLPVKEEIKMLTLKMAYMVSKMKIPEEIAVTMPINTTGHRIETHSKFSAKPKWLNSTLLRRNSLRSRMYLFNTLPKEITTKENKVTFKKAVKNYLNKKYHGY